MEPFRVPLHAALQSQALRQESHDTPEVTTSFKINAATTVRMISEYIHRGAP